MSYNIDGKVVNQPIRKRMDGQVICSRCSLRFKAPSKVVMSLTAKTSIFINHYIGEDYFVYETKKGHAVMYCSDDCRRKHNHRY